MIHKFSLALGAVLFLASCRATAPAQSVISIKPSTASASASYALALVVNGPAELASGGKIVTEGGTGLIKGGQIVAGGGGNIVAGGGGNIVAGGGGNFAAGGGFDGPTFRLAAAIDQFAPVASAEVQLLDLDGKPIGEVQTVKDGRGTVSGIPSGKVSRGLVAFKTGGKVYRMSVMVGLGDAAEGKALMADPINTMVEAWLRRQIANKGSLGPVTFDRLSAVWTICNKADITVPASKLDASLSVDAQTDALIQTWTDAIAKVSGEDKTTLSTFIAEVKATIAAK